MDNSRRYRWLALTLIVGSAVLRIAYLGWFCPLDLAPDEAHYWDWSRHLDWSYYSKGPLVAWLIHLSCVLFGPLAQALTGQEMLAVRLPAVLCGSLLLAGLYVLTVQAYQSEKLGCAVIALALTLPTVAAGSSLMTIDAPFACSWMWALVFGFHAVFGRVGRLSRAVGRLSRAVGRLSRAVGTGGTGQETRPTPWAWPAAGACILLGILAKPTMVLWLPSFTLFLLATPPLRGTLRTRGFWILTGIGTLGGVPILAWNVANDWVMFRHTQGHAGLDDDQVVSWLGPLKYLGTQFAILLGFWFVAWARAMICHRPTRETRPELGYLWWMSAPTFVFFALFSWRDGGGEPNWPLAGYLSGMVLTAGWMAREWVEPRPWRRQLAKAGTLAFATLGLLFVGLLHQPLYLQPVLLQLAGPASAQHPAPIRRVDPTTRMRGWRFLAAEVDRVRAELRAQGIEPILATERWTQAGEVGFYCEGHPAVYCLGVAVGDRHSQYDLWRPNPVADRSAFQGQTFLLVGTDTDPLCRFFATSEPIRIIAYRENGQLIDTWTLTIAHDFQGSDAPETSKQY